MFTGGRLQLHLARSFDMDFVEGGRDGFWFIEYFIGFGIGC